MKMKSIRKLGDTTTTTTTTKSICSAINVSASSIKSKQQQKSIPFSTTETKKSITTTFFQHNEMKRNQSTTSCFCNSMITKTYPPIGSSTWNQHRSSSNSGRIKSDYGIISDDNLRECARRISNMNNNNNSKSHNYRTMSSSASILNDSYSDPQSNTSNTTANDTCNKDNNTTDNNHNNELYEQEKQQSTQQNQTQEQQIQSLSDDIPENVRTIILEYAQMPVSPASLQTLIRTGKGESILSFHESSSNTNTITNMHRLSTAHVLLQMSNFLCKEIPIRLAHRIYDLDNVPYMKDVSAVQHVKQIYINSFIELVQYQQQNQTQPIIQTPIEEEQFANHITILFQNHANVLVQMAKGAYQLREQIRQSNVNNTTSSNLTSTSSSSTNDYDETLGYFNIIHSSNENYHDNSNDNNNQDNANSSSNTNNALQFEQMKVCHEFLDRFYLARIGIRVLVGQYLALRADYIQRRKQEELASPLLISNHPSKYPSLYLSSSLTNNNNSNNDNSYYIGMICQRTSPVQIVKQAITDVTYICRRTYNGRAPMINIEGNFQLTFPYIPTYLHYVLIELLKNSVRATMERHGSTSTNSRTRIPPVTVIIADGTDQEDVVIKIMDEGGGIPRSQMNHIWSYLYTTVDPSIQRSFLVDDDNDNTNNTTMSKSDTTITKNNSTTTATSNTTGGSTIIRKDHSTDTPIAGLGYGLPISRDYCKYFGGELDIISMEGYGTDAFLHLKRLGDSIEPVPL